jgi:uncharacterized protein YkwD
MANSGQIWHTDPSNPNGPYSFPNDVCFRFGPIGENVGYWNSGDEAQDLRNIHNLMMTGQGEQHDPQTCQSTVNHACNIVSSAYSSVGIGIVVQGGSTWLTEDFIG